MNALPCQACCAASAHVMDRDFLFAIAEDEEREGSIPKADIVAGIRSDDTELAGVIYDIVTTDKLRKRIEPPLADKELDGLITEHFERCILTDPKGEWTLTRYGAAWEAQAWGLAHLCTTTNEGCPTLGFSRVGTADVES